MEKKLSIISLKIVRDSDSKFLFELLKERDPRTNISHKKMPSYDEHVNFILSNPYVIWYIIEYEGKNVSNKTITSTANFIAEPEAFQAYLVKTECFCFTEQTLKSGESQIFTMVFFVDPSMDSVEKLKDLDDLNQLAFEEENLQVQKEVLQNIKDLRSEVKKNEIKCFLSNEADPLNCYIEIHAGAGGTESFNVGVGKTSLFSISTGQSNVALGANAGYAITTSSNNVLFGFAAGNNPAFNPAPITQPEVLTWSSSKQSLILS